MCKTKWIDYREEWGISNASRFHCPYECSVLILINWLSFKQETTIIINTIYQLHHCAVLRVPHTHSHIHFHQHSFDPKWTKSPRIPAFTPFAHWILLLVSYHQAPFSKSVSTPFDHEQLSRKLLAWRGDRGHEQLLDCVEFGCERKEENGDIFLSVMTRSFPSTPYHGLCWVCGINSGLCVGCGSTEILTQNEVVFGNESARLSQGNISWNPQETAWNP